MNEMICYLHDDRLFHSLVRHLSRFLAENGMEIGERK